jgi:hypothetical protein
LSALADGEAPIADPYQTRAHVARCADCQRWEQVAADVSRRTRIGGRLPDLELTDQISAAVDLDLARRRSRGQWLVAVVMVVLCGALQLVVSVPLLLLAHRGGSGHGRLLVVLELLVGASFFAGAVVLLWHTRGAPVDSRVVASTVPEDRPDTNAEGVA